MPKRHTLYLKDIKQLPHKLREAIHMGARQGSGRTQEGGGWGASNVGLGTVLRSMAVRRIKKGGDSTHKYPELWFHKNSRRRNGKPLQDTGRLWQSLFSESHVKGNVISLKLMDGTGYGIYHQHGYSTTGPNYIPLSKKGRIAPLGKHTLGANPREEGLKSGKDYIVLPDGVTVPQRMIFNLPPEDRKVIAEAIWNGIRKSR